MKAHRHECTQFVTNTRFQMVCVECRRVYGKPQARRPELVQAVVPIERKGYSDEQGFSLWKN